MCNPLIFAVANFPNGNLGRIAARVTNPIPSPDSTLEMMASVESNSVATSMYFIFSPSFSRAISSTLRVPEPRSRSWNAFQIIPRQELAVFPWMICRIEQYQLVLHKGFDAHVLPHCRPLNETDCNCSIEHPINNLLGVPAADLQFHTGNVPV
jgi:hypothetical protein